MRESDVHAAQRYLECLEAADGPLTPDEIDAIKSSIDAIQRGEITLEDFERKYGSLAG